MDHFVGIDLHSNNSYIAVIDTDNNRTFKKKASNNLTEIIKLLAPFKNRLKGLLWNQPTTGTGWLMGLWIRAINFILPILRLSNSMKD